MSSLTDWFPTIWHDYLSRVSFISNCSKKIQHLNEHIYNTFSLPVWPPWCFFLPVWTALSCGRSGRSELYGRRAEGSTNPAWFGSMWQQGFVLQSIRQRTLPRPSVCVWGTRLVAWVQQRGWSTAVMADLRTPTSAPPSESGAPMSASRFSDARSPNRATHSLFRITHFKNRQPYCSAWLCAFGPVTEPV